MTLNEREDLIVIEPHIGSSERRCEDYDESCIDILNEGYVLTCWLYDTSRGRCPFVGD